MYSKSCLHVSAKRDFNKALFTLCPPYVMFQSVWNLRSVTEGGALWLPGHLILCVLQGRWEEKEHNWIRYQNRVSVCFNQSGDTGSSWKHRVKRAWREGKWEKEEGRESEREGERGRERQRGQPGWLVPRLWRDNGDWRLEGKLSGRWLASQSSLSGLQTEGTVVTSTIPTSSRQICGVAGLFSTQHQQIIRQRGSLKRGACVKLPIYLL